MIQDKSLFKNYESLQNFKVNENNLTSLKNKNNSNYY